MGVELSTIPEQTSAYSLKSEVISHCSLLYDYLFSPFIPVNGT